MENPDQMNERIESIQMNFDKMSENMSFMCEQLCKLDKTNKIKLHFENCFIAISKNGGLIAICKKKGFLDIDSGTLLNDNIIVMHQNAIERYTIPIDWDYKKTYFVCFDFNDDEQLYGICNDGSVYKIDILTQQAKEKPSSQTFKEDNIESAKLFEKGYIALTKSGKFYLIRDAKNSIAELLFPMTKLLNVDASKVSYIAIPSNKSKSRETELLVTNPLGGIIHVVRKTDGNFKITQKESDGPQIISNVSRILSTTIEDYIVNENPKSDVPNSLGVIDALAISPSGNQIAMYNKSRQTAYFFHSKIDNDLKKFPRMQAEYIINTELSEPEQQEQTAVLTKFEDGTQFLFCGEDAVVVCGRRFIFLINTINKTLVYKITENGEFDAMNGAIFAKCISETDGLRYATNDGVFLISRVQQELYDSLYYFSEKPGKKLLGAYRSALLKQANCDKEIRAIGDEISKAITTLQVAAANLFWIDNDKDDEKHKKEVQLYLLRASQHGKNFVKKEDFNFDKFVEICKDIRIINNLRNCQKPRFLTYAEYKNLTTKQLIKRSLRLYNFQIAFEICKYLDYPLKKVYQRYAYSQIKKLRPHSTRDKEVFEEIMSVIKPIQNISYIKLAKKAYKFNHPEMGGLFLGEEKSLLTKIPEYVRQGNWDNALKDAFDTYDANVLMTVIDKLFKSVSVDEFINIVGKYPKANTAVLEYLRTNEYDDEMQRYLKAQNNHEQIFFAFLANFFRQKKINERRATLISLKEEQRHIEKMGSNTNFDNKFYKNYLDQLEKSLDFKQKVVHCGIIKATDTSNFDNTIYDCYKCGIKAEKQPFIKKENDNCFELSLKKMTILRMKAYCEMKRPDGIEAMLKENTMKKLGITPLNVAEIYYEYGNKDKAIEYLKQVNDIDYLEYKIEMMKSLEKYEDALEAIISDKKNENMGNMVNDILIRRPDLKSKVDELCNKYKINLK